MFEMLYFITATECSILNIRYTSFHLNIKQQLQCHHSTLHPQHRTLHSQDSMKKLAFYCKHNDDSEMRPVKYLLTGLLIQIQISPLAPSPKHQLYSLNQAKYWLNIRLSSKPQTLHIKTITVW